MGAKVILSGCLLLLVAQHIAANNDFTCVKGKVKKTFKMKEGETYSLSTEGDAGYNAKQKCNVLYKVNKCKKKKAVISCDDFDLGVVKRNCTRGDRMIIKPAKKPKQSFCGADGPIDLEINKNFKVTFISDKKTTDDEVGFKCQVACAEDDDGGNGGTTDGTTTGVPATTTTAAAPTADYCALNPDHTMCIYEGPSEECTKKTKYRGLSPEFKAVVLEKHNNYRSKVALGLQEGQPPAANMNKLVWNDELEAIAQRFTDQCKFGHDKIRWKLDGTKSGQNAGLAYRWLNEDNYQADAVTAVDRWYNEVKDFNSSWIDPFVFTMKTGHYTQVVWADTTEVGCGVTYYEDGRANNLIVCNYAIAGNFRNRSVYKIGEACTKCPSGTSCTDGLCVAA